MKSLILVEVFISLASAHANPVSDVAKKFEGSYQVVQCTGRTPYTPIVVTVWPLDGYDGTSGAYISVKEGFLTANVFIASKIGRTDEKASIDTNWGCRRETQTVDLDDSKIEFSLKTLFYNLCVFPDFGSKLSHKQSFELSGDKVLYKGRFKTQDLDDKEDCVLARE